MFEKRNSITIDIDEYEFEIIFRNHPLKPPYVYMFIRKYCATEYWARFYQKDSRYILIDEHPAHIGIELDYAAKQKEKFKNLLKEARIIELIEGEVCLKNDILLQLI